MGAQPQGFSLAKGELCCPAKVSHGWGKVPLTSRAVVVVLPSIQLVPWSPGDSSSIGVNQAPFSNFLLQPGENRWDITRFLHRIIYLAAFCWW